MAYVSCYAHSKRWQLEDSQTPLRSACDRSAPHLPHTTTCFPFRLAARCRYIERVYHQRLSGTQRVDANMLSFMYAGAHANTVLAVDPCVQVCVYQIWPNRHRVYDGSVWRGNSGPESLASGALGFFIHRAYIQASAAQSCRRLEVMHVRTNWLDGEHGVSWFFNAVGSGVFLDCEHLGARGSIEVHRNRQSFVDRHGEGWASDGDAHVREKMAAAGIALLIFTASDFSVFGGAHENPSTEFIARHTRADSTELNTARRSCLDDPAVGLRFWTGVNADVPCSCEVRDVPAAINCDLTPLQQV